MTVSNPTVVRRQLGRRLRRLREAARKSEYDVEESRLASRTKLWRLESGRVAAKLADVRALCWLYGADTATTDALLELTRGTLSQGWWEEYGDAVPNWFRMFVDLENAASQITVYQSELVPGIFQTERYATAVCRAALPDADEEALIRKHVKVRMERQQILSQRWPQPTYRVVLNAAVLAREVGGEAVIDEQVRRLREVSVAEHVQMRVLPWSAGAHAAMPGPFTIFESDDPDDPDTIYIETDVGARYLEKPAEVARYRKIYALISQQAVPLEEYRP